MLDPFRSTIVIRGSPFGGCYSNSACSGERLVPSNAEECCVKSVGTHFSDGTTCLQCIGTSFIATCTCMGNFPGSKYSLV